MKSLKFTSFFWKKSDKINSHITGANQLARTVGRRGLQCYSFYHRKAQNTTLTFESGLNVQVKCRANAVEVLKGKKKENSYIVHW